jgi:hypothetical protein
MSYTLKMSGVIVGRSELETRDDLGHRASGAFRAGLGYELAQPVFDLYVGADGSAEGLTKYQKARDALRLELTSSSGAPVRFRELHIRREGDSLVLEIETDGPLV